MVKLVEVVELGRLVLMQQRAQKIIRCPAIAAGSLGQIDDADLGGERAGGLRAWKSKRLPSRVINRAARNILRRTLAILTRN